MYRGATGPANRADWVSRVSGIARRYVTVIQTRSRSDYGSPSPKYSFSRQGHPSNGTGLTIITALPRGVDYPLLRALVLEAIASTIDRLGISRRFLVTVPEGKSIRVALGHEKRNRITSTFYPK